MTWFEPMLRFAQGNFYTDFEGVRAAYARLFNVLALKFTSHGSELDYKIFTCCLLTFNMFDVPRFSQNDLCLTSVFCSVGLKPQTNFLTMGGDDQLWECSVFISWCSTFLFPSLRIIPPRTPQQRKVNGQSVYAQNNMNISGNIVKHPRKSQILWHTSAP